MHRFRSPHCSPVALAAALVPAALAVAPGAQGQSAAAEANLVASSESGVTADSGATGAGLDELDGPASYGFEAQARIDVSLPLGAAGDGRSQADEVEYRGGLWLDLGYRINEMWLVGAFLGAGVGPAKDCTRPYEAFSGGDLPDDAGCSLDDLRFGAEVQVRPFGSNRGLWLGGGVGYEEVQKRLQFLTSVEGFGEQFATLKEKKSGAMVVLQGGWDFHVDGFFNAGPYASYIGGLYTRADYECPAMQPCPTGDDYDAGGLHHWLSLGVRGTFGP